MSALCRRAARLLARAIPRCRTGPGPRHPESVTAELSQADEDLLAEIDFELWPRQGRPGRLRANYELRPADGDEEAAS